LFHYLRKEVNLSRLRINHFVNKSTNLFKKQKFSNSSFQNLQLVRYSDFSIFEFPDPAALHFSAQEGNRFTLEVECRGPAARFSRGSLFLPLFSLSLSFFVFMCNTIPGCNFSRTFPLHPSETPVRSTCILDALTPARFRIPQTHSDLVWRITFPEILSRYLPKGSLTLLACAA